jgi:hypothetical protein
MTKKKVWLAFVVLMLSIGILITGFENGNGPETKEYTVTIGTLTNDHGSTITANPMKGEEGTEITLTVTPIDGYKLKEGSLKYNGTQAINETTKKFNLPAENVTITAEFEAAVDNISPKKITVNGLDGQAGNLRVVIFSGIGTNGPNAVAVGEETISGGSVTVNLKIYVQGTQPTESWTGSGSYNVQILFVTGEDIYFYTDGKTFVELGINEAADMEKLPKLNFNSAITTVNFNKFALGGGSA